MANLNNHISSFIKISLITTLLFGGLLAQSYATNAITETLIRMNVEFAATDGENNLDEKASVVVHDEKLSNFKFGDYELAIKTNFVDHLNAIKDSDELQINQFLTEVKLKQLGESGQFELIGSPSMLMLRNQWAELKFNTESEEDNIEFKIKYQGELDDINEKVELDESGWLKIG